MTLSTNVYDLAVRVATESKALRTLINGNLADLSSLDTTAKTNLVAAINEIAAAVATASGIDDGQISTSTSWSSTKTNTEIGSAVATASTADRMRSNHSGTESADVLVDGTTNKAYTAGEKTKLAGIATAATANQTDAYLLNLANHTGSIPTSQVSGFVSDVDARVQLIVDAAPGALDTLNELAAAIGDDPTFGATVTAALSNRVRVDAAQSLTAPQQAQARANIGAQAAAEIGATDSNYVTAFEAALL